MRNLVAANKAGVGGALTINEVNKKLADKKARIAGFFVDRNTTNPTFLSSSPSRPF